MAYLVVILAVNFKFYFYCMNKTVKIHQNPTDTSEYDATKRGKQYKICLLYTSDAADE